MFRLTVNVLKWDNNYFALEYNIRGRTFCDIVAGVMSHGPSSIQPASPEIWAKWAEAKDVEEDATVWIKFNGNEFQLEFVVRETVL